MRFTSVFLFVCLVAFVSSKHHVQSTMPHIHRSQHHHGLLQELDEVDHKMGMQRQLEEAPGEYYRYCQYDLIRATADDDDVGSNFIICVENELSRGKWYDNAGFAFNFAMGILTGPIWAAAKASSFAFQGDWAKAADSAIDALTSLDATGTAGAIKLSAALIGKALSNTNKSYIMCATCASALAWALANDKFAVTRFSPRSLRGALQKRLYKKHDRRGIRGTRTTCPLSTREQAKITEANDSLEVDSEHRVRMMLIVIGQSYIDYLTSSIAEKVFHGLQSPVQALFSTRDTTAANILENIRTPSTEAVTKKKDGGWLVNDLTYDYFDDDRPPKEYFNPSTFKYRDCQRVCDGAFDVRTCSRECTCSIQ